ncbi:MAG: DUF4397 domain-containing protein [Pseudomonadota bacterium]
MPMSPQDSRRHALAPVSLPILLLLALLMATVTGCGSSSSSSSDGTGQVQLINGMPDSPQFRVEINDSDDDLVETVSVFGFQQASNLVSLSRGTYTIEVFFEDPETGFDERFLNSEIDVRDNTIYQGVLHGTYANSQLTWYDKDEGNVTDTEEEFEVQVINLSQDTVTTYLGDTNEGLTTATTVATVVAGNISDPQILDFAEDTDYTVRLTADGSSELLYDSGTVTIGESTRNTIVVNGSVGPDPDSPALFIVRDASVIVFPNELANASLRMINAVNDVADAEVQIDVSATGEVVLDEILSLDAVSNAVRLAPDFIDVEVVTPNASASSLTTTVSLAADTAYSIIVAGSALEDDVSIRANEMDVRSVANALNIHFINALRETDDEDINVVDLYTLPLGDTLSTTTPAATSVSYLEGVSVTVGATAYDLVVTTGGTLSILAGPARIFPNGGERVIAVATEAVGGGRPFRLTLTETDE